jgi:hypothetical protein
LTVRSTRKPWVTPSTKRTETGAAEAGRSHTSTVTRTSKQSVAALVNNMRVEQKLCVPPGRLPALCRRRLRSLFQSNEHLKVSAPSLASWSPSQKPKIQPYLSVAVPNSTNTIISSVCVIIHAFLHLQPGPKRSGPSMVEKAFEPFKAGAVASSRFKVQSSRRIPSLFDYLIPLLLAVTHGSVARSRRSSARRALSTVINSGLPFGIRQSSLLFPRHLL